MEYLITAVIILGYGATLGIFNYKGFLNFDNFISNLTIFIGWIIALLIAWIHLQKTRRDNTVTKKAEIKKNLEIAAFREINKGITKFSEKITSVSTPYISWPSRLKLHIENPTVFKFNTIEIDLEIQKQIVNLYKGHADFILAIESVEIMVIKFDHLRNYILLRVDDVIESIRNFQKYFTNINKKELLAGKSYSEFEKKCYEVHKEILNIQMYLFDYRIELMNSMLGDIFDAHVPVRKPKDPKYKILTEVAIKEEVKKEFKTREDKLMKKD